MIIVTALDEISWVLNIRGRESEYFPVVRAYLVITDKVIYLYTNASRFSYNVNGTLKIDSCYNANCVRYARVCLIRPVLGEQMLTPNKLSEFT